jgi:hypothetical protein
MPKQRTGAAELVAYPRQNILTACRHVDISRLESRSRPSRSLSGAAISATTDQIDWPGKARSINQTPVYLLVFWSQTQRRAECG